MLVNSGQLLFFSVFASIKLQRLCLTRALCSWKVRKRLKIVNCSGDCYFIFICLFIADTKSIVWIHTLCRTQVEKTYNTERSTRHWSRRNHRVTDTFCNCKKWAGNWILIESVLCFERLCAICRVVLLLWNLSSCSNVVFNVYKEDCPWDRKIVDFDNVCKLQRGNVIESCCFL